MTRKLQAQDLLSFQLAGDVQMAPGGDRVAFVTSRIDQEKNTTTTSIYMAAPGSPAVRFTGGESDTAPRFSPDGSQLAFISRRSGQAQVWLMSLQGGEARQLTKVQGGVGEFAWAPDGARIAFTALLKSDGIQPEVKEEEEADLLKKHTKSVKTITELSHKLDGEGYFGERRACLCITALTEDAKPVQLTHPPYQVQEIAWTPAGQHLLVTGRIGADYDRGLFENRVYVIAAEGGETRQLTPSAIDCSGAAVSPDGQTVAVLMTDPEKLGYDNVRICLVPFTGGELTAVAPAYDRPFGNIGLADMPAPGGWKLTWAPDGAALFALTSVDGTVQVARVEIATGKVDLQTHGDHLIYSFSMDARCRKVAFGQATPANPADIYFQDLREGVAEPLTALNRDLLAELELSIPQHFTARAPGGPLVDGWIMRPHGFEAGKQYPTVLEIHGGPMMMYAAAFFFEFQLLAAQGYGVIYSNPRGSQGYGEDFCMAIQKEWGNKDYADIMAILDQAIADNAWIDTTRLGVTGGSYGGFMTNWIVGHTDRFKAAVTGRSICDWRMMVGTGDGGPYWMKKFDDVPFWVDDSAYKQQSPITYVANVKTPILIEHQEGDLRCPVDQGMMWYSVIKNLGQAPVRFVTYPGEFHGMSRNGKPWNRIHRLGEITAWFAQYLPLSAWAGQA
ncbi:MAG TPA: S9 family peptidase [Symbiobacteriaceae bacterium]|nr:S9 family peptidase [Symbiobacteriaceae bacterium]